MAGESFRRHRETLAGQECDPEGCAPTGHQRGGRVDGQDLVWTGAAAPEVSAIGSEVLAKL